MQKNDYFSLPSIKSHYQQASGMYKAEALSSTVILAMLLIFWVWVGAQPNFAVGLVTDSAVLATNNTVIEVKHPLKTDYVLSDEAFLDEVDGLWVFAYGEERIGHEPMLLNTEHMEFLQTLVSLITMPVKSWVHKLEEFKYAPLILASILLLSAGRVFRYGYTLIMMGFVTISAWHVMYAAQWLGVLSFDTAGLVVVMVVSALLAARWSLVHSRFAVTNSIMAALVWLCFGSVVMAWLGLVSDTWSLLILLGAVFFPLLVSTLLAAYLLGQAFDVAHSGVFVLLLITGLISLNQALGLKTVTQKAHTFYSTMHKRFGSSKFPWTQKGRVGISEFLDKSL